MRTVEVLSRALADQIAAGEVVERPASVVKELVENALDAGASSITVEMDGAGLERIAVRDDGHGMNRANATLALRRHATSKLRAIEDLAELHTLGFRGEALPSIASVSKLELTTRTQDGIEGTCVRVEAGEAAVVRPWGGPVGTRVEVRSLFFNVPARRKFLKSAATESRHVAQTLRRVALARPDVRLELVRDGRTALDFLPARDVPERLRALYPDERFSALDEAAGSIRVQAWLGAAARAPKGSAHLYSFVNGRAVQDRVLVRAVVEGLGDTLGRGHCPRGAAFLTVPPALLDVNAHPQKTEVRFAESLEVPRTIASLLATARFRASVQPSTAAAATPAPSTPRPARRGPTARRGFWEERLGAGPLVHGSRVGTARLVEQGRVPSNGSSSTLRKPPSKAPAPGAQAPPPATASRAPAGERVQRGAAEQAPSHTAQPPADKTPSEHDLDAALCAQVEARVAQRLDYAATQLETQAEALEAKGSQRAAGALRAAARTLREGDDSGS